jgi:hypothetical protein
MLVVDWVAVGCDRGIAPASDFLVSSYRSLSAPLSSIYTNRKGLNKASQATKTNLEDPLRSSIVNSYHLRIFKNLFQVLAEAHLLDFPNVSPRSTEPQDIMADKKRDEITIESLPKLLENDTKVKLAGVDVDGILRGKLISKKKFLGIAKEGFGFCSVIFGWDMHDQTYFRELKISNADNGYHDLIAIPDLSSFRRIPWEDEVPFFLVSFFDPDSGKPVSACPRGLLKTTVDKLHAKGYGAMAGGTLSRCS